MVNNMALAEALSNSKFQSLLSRISRTIVTVF
jgi:hypothetical protein